MRSRNWRASQRKDRGKTVKKNGKKISTTTRMLTRDALSSRQQRASVPKPKRLILGRYIVADPKICHGKPTIRGTRVMVSQVLDQVALGMDWESISERWGGVSRKKPSPKRCIFRVKRSLNMRPSTSSNQSRHEYSG